MVVLMIEAYIRRNEGDVINYRGSWAAGSVYDSWNVVINNSMTYYCKLGHTASTNNKPGEGASWTTYWESWGPAGVIWGNRALNIMFDGGGVALTTGVKAMIEVPFPLKITSGKLFSLDGTSGSIQISLWKDTYANFPPTSSDNIHTFLIYNAIKSSESVNLTLAQGNIILFNIDYVANIKIACLSLMLGVT